jgi:hypothetical protein
MPKHTGQLLLSVQTSARDPEDVYYPVTAPERLPPNTPSIERSALSQHGWTSSSSPKSLALQSALLLGKTAGDSTAGNRITALNEPRHWRGWAGDENPASWLTRYSQRPDPIDFGRCTAAMLVRNRSVRSAARRRSVLGYRHARPSTIDWRPRPNLPPPGPRGCYHFVLCPNRVTPAWRTCSMPAI